MNWLNKLRRLRWAISGRKKIKRIVRLKKSKGEAVKIILGAGHHQLTDKDWICTDLPQFDITKAAHWDYLFKNTKIDAILAEHVLEHLTQAQIQIALGHASNYLKIKGTFRIAVPDKNNPHPLYQNGTKPGGSDEGADDHKVFLSLNDLQSIVQNNSFTLIPLEYYDTQGVFHSSDYNNENGYILRSKKNNFNYPPIPNYSSLIFDLKRN